MYYLFNNLLMQDLHYSTLMKSLEIDTTRQLEDLCINTIYASLLTGKLSPHTQTFQITSCTSRDVSPPAVDYEGMITTLNLWSKQCDLVLAEISGRIRDVKADVANRKAAEEEFEKELEDAKKSTSGKRASKSKAAGEVHDYPEDDIMDVDGEGIAGSPKAERAEGESPGSPKARKRKLVLSPALR